jgi:Tfp pilus assembly PilM family ATPase
METLLQETRTRHAEIEDCAGQLREALKQKRSGAIESVVERLLRLQPNHPLARKVAGRMRDQLIAKAEARTAARRYDDALELLVRIPAPARTSRSETLREDVLELSALSWDANHSPFVDGILKEALKRLLQRLPKDEAVRKLVAEFKKRAPRLNAPERTAPVPWAKTNKTPWDCPVEWKAGFDRIELAEDVPVSILRDYPGRFAIACGLALQGIEEGAVRIDLGEESPGVVGRVAKLMHSKRRDTAWGIDIGNDSLKMVKLRTADGGRRVVALACAVFPHRKLLSQAVDYGEARDIVEESFGLFRGQHSLKGERLCVSLPGRLTVCRTLHLPHMEEKRTGEALRFEAQHVLPGELDDFRWRCYRPTLSGETLEDRQSSHLLLAIGRQHIEQIEETFRRLKIQPDIVQTEYLALHNFLGFELAKEEQNGESDRRATVLLDMGAGGTNMIVHSSRYLWGRYLGAGGHTFTRTILREFRLTLQQAEEWKRDPSQVDRWSRWEEALGSVFESFGKELRSALDAFAKDYPGERVGRILVVGGGAEMHGLIRYLSTGR